MKRDWNAYRKSLEERLDLYLFEAGHCLSLAEAMRSIVNEREGHYGRLARIAARRVIRLRKLMTAAELQQQDRAKAVQA